MKRDQIFFSDDEVSQDQRAQNYKSNSIEFLLESIINSQGSVKFQGSDEKREKIQEQERFKMDLQEFCVVKIEQKETERKIQSINTLENLETKIPEPPAKRERKKDQNACKKLHKIINKCLRKLFIYKYLKKGKHKTCNKNYLVFALIVANKAKALKQFMDQYKKQVIKEVKIGQLNLNLLEIESKQYKRTKCFIEIAHPSIRAMELYQKGDTYGCLLGLYDIENIKTKNCIAKSYNQIVEFEKTIQLN